MWGKLHKKYKRIYYFKSGYYMLEGHVQPYGRLDKTYLNKWLEIKPYLTYYVFSKIPDSVSNDTMEILDYMYFTQLTPKNSKNRDSKYTEKIDQVLKSTSKKQNISYDIKGVHI